MDLVIERVALDSLIPHPRNVRHGDVGAISQSLEAHGQFRALMVQKSTRHIIGGNHTWRAMKSLGWSDCDVTIHDVDDEEALRILLADNRLSDLATNDDAGLALALEELARSPQGLTGTGYDGDDLDALLADLVEIPPTADAVPEIPKTPKSQRGDLYLLGDHRVMCGDSFSSDMDILLDTLSIDFVLTDPPYGIDLDTDYSPGGGRVYRPVEGDDHAFDASALRERFADVPEQFWWGANYYLRSLTPSDLNGSWLVWDKRDEATDIVVGSGFELCWSATKHKQDLLRYHWTNFTSHDNAGAKREHPTEKPVAMLVEILSRWADSGAVVVDPFAGTGSTMMACELTGRTALLMEIGTYTCGTEVFKEPRFTGVWRIEQRKTIRTKVRRLWDRIGPWFDMRC